MDKIILLLFTFIKFFDNFLAQFNVFPAIFCWRTLSRQGSSHADVWKIFQRLNWEKEWGGPRVQSGKYLMTNSLTVESTAFRSLSTLLISFLFGFVSFLLLQLSASCRVAAECKPSKKADVQDLGKEHTEMESKGAESKQFDHVLLIKTYLIIVGKHPPPTPASAPPRTSKGPRGQTWGWWQSGPVCPAIISLEMSTQLSTLSRVHYPQSHRGAEARSSIVW